MSRVGRKPIEVPSGVQVSFSERQIHVEGPKGKLSFQIPNPISVRLEGNTLLVTRPGDGRMERSLHGVTRSVVANLVEGVSKGFERNLTIEGLGYRAKNEGKVVVFNLGYSHPILFSPPSGIEVEVVRDTQVFIRGIDKHLVGEVAAKIRRLRPPDAYKGKGVRYKEEKVKLKPGKAGA